MNQKTGYLPWNCTIVLGSTILRPFKVTFSQIVTFWTPGAIAMLYYLVASVVFMGALTNDYTELTLHFCLNNNYSFFQNFRVLNSNYTNLDRVE